MIKLRSQAAELLSPELVEILEKGINLAKPSRAYLFRSSVAEGVAELDLAFEFDAPREPTWVRFQAAPHENELKMKMVDWINSTETDEKSRQELRRDAVVLYDDTSPI